MEITLYPVVKHKAKKYPDKYLSIIINGMDRAKTMIPHYIHLSKAVSGMWRLRLHLTDNDLSCEFLFVEQWHKVSLTIFSSHMEATLL